MSIVSELDINERDRNAESPLTVMIIDDHRSMRSIIRSLLNQIGVTSTIEAEDGVQALEQLNRIGAPEIDLILCDLMMDGMDGLEFANNLRRSQTLSKSQTPLLILTAETDKFLLDVVRQVGVSDIVNKPISAPDLCRRIEQLVGFRLPGCEPAV